MNTWCDEHVCSDCPGSRPGGPCWYPDNWDEIEALVIIDDERAKDEEAYEQEQEYLACAEDMQINEYSFTRGDKS